MIIRFFCHRGVQLFFLTVLLATAVFLRLQDPPSISRMRYLTFDYYNKIIPRAPHDDTVIIDIDEDSIARYGQWPWPRTRMGDIVAALKEMGAKSIVFDMVFSEPDRTSPAYLALALPPDMGSLAEEVKKLPGNDELFAQKIAGAGNVVTGFVGAFQTTDHSVEGKASLSHHPDPSKDFSRYVPSLDNFAASLPVLSAAAAGNGSFNATPEQDGVIRQVQLMVRKTGEEGNDKVYPALSLEGIRVAEKKQSYIVRTFQSGILDVRVGNHVIPTDEYGRMYVYYAGHRPEIYIPAWQVLAAGADAEKQDALKKKIDGKIVFIGTSAIGLLDLRSSPLNPVLPGVEIHAEVVEQVLHNQFLKRLPGADGAELIGAVIVCALLIFLSPFIGAGWLALIVALLVGGSVFGGVYAYKAHGYLIDVFYPSVMVVFIFIISSILANLRTEMEKRAVRQAFSHYISPVLMEELANNPDKLKLGGEVRELSIMFTDIRNFTTISQGMDPADLIRMMNDFLTPMTSRVLENRGTVDKYMGDAMMAFWNAPLDDPDHARHACKSALEMVASLAPVNEKLKAEAEKAGKPFKELKAGIGINSGPASVGNMGSRQRFAYSALGDTVNLASRVEGQTKGYGVSVMMTEATHKAAPEFAAIELDLLTVKGRTEPVRVYALLGGPEMAANDDFKAFAARHAAFLAAYRAQKWADAEALSAECLKMRPDLSGFYALFAERVSTFKTSAPPHDWDGVWVAKEK